jgi:hypothetical protein
LPTIPQLKIALKISGKIVWQKSQIIAGFSREVILLRQA